MSAPKGWRSRTQRRPPTLSNPARVRQLRHARAIETFVARARHEAARRRTLVATIAQTLPARRRAR